MLLLQLTDGTVEIGAIEYHTIPFLSTETPPGIKVHICVISIGDFYSYTCVTKSAKTGVICICDYRHS